MTGDVVLMNALELIDWDSDRTQILICESCGTSGCGSGGWIVPRVDANHIFLIPAFDAIEADAWSRDEYSPPSYRRKEGTPYFELRDYDRLVATAPSLPTADDIHPLAMREAVRLAQLQIPYQIFGDPPEIQLTREKASLVVAASEGEPADHLATIESLLRDHYDNAEAAHLRSPRADEEIVYLFLDAAEFTDWPALVKTRNGPRLLLTEEFLIEPAKGN
jgi:hypothetical protein